MAASRIVLALSGVVVDDLDTAGQRAQCRTVSGQPLGPLRVGGLLLDILSETQTRPI
ncbi:hypothetical protein ACFV2X_10145 [Streptomyces sp. NPDC059679]|uniref:hypothetical protein n=1 Tax=Streptomyces sp. NPDC059679 TaxID=3346903 RepID=UPI0036C0D3D9